MDDMFASFSALQWEGDGMSGGQLGLILCQKTREGVISCAYDPGGL